MSLGVMLRWALFSVSLLLSLILVSATEEVDPAEITIGERLFLETRFSQIFH